MDKSLSGRYFNIIVIVASLGYFVDIYDLILFGIVKNPSLIDLGIEGKDALFNRGNFLLSMQMAGMLVGGTGLWLSGVIVGVIFIGIAFISAFLTEETHGKELDYLEI